MATYRDPDTGRFITYSRWRELERELVEDFDDWEDLDAFAELGEDEY